MQIHAISFTLSAGATLYRTPNPIKVASTGVLTLASLDLLRPDYQGGLMQLWIAGILRGTEREVSPLINRKSASCFLYSLLVSVRHLDDCDSKMNPREAV